MGNPTLPSAMYHFTAEFGMESGGSNTLMPPGMLVEDGVSLFSRATFNQISSSSRTVVSAYQSIENLEDDISTKELNLITDELSQFDVTIREFENFEQAFQRFKENEFWIFCFLTDNRAERYKIARMAMNKEGITGSKDKAKQWLAVKEAGLRKAFKADIFMRYLGIYFSVSLNELNTTNGENVVHVK